MPWIPEEYMAGVHIIRQDYALALKAYENDPCEWNGAALTEIEERRARAIRSLSRDDNASVRHLSGMFRCSKTTIREALEDEEA